MATTLKSLGDALTRRPSTTPPRISRTDAEALAAELRDTIEGEVRFDNGSRALYSTDSSIYRQVPIGVVIPRSSDDVLATIAAARRYGAPILPRGCGTSCTGQTCNFAVVMDFSKYLHNVLEIDPIAKIGRVQPGTICDDLRDTAEQHHLTFGPDPATHTRCTLGGMIGNNSCGIHSVMAGKTEDNVESLEIVTYDGIRMRVGKTSEEELERIIAEGGRRGEIYAGMKRIRDTYGQLIRERFPNIPRRVSGYNLNELLPENGFHVARALVGTEGTCVTMLEATLRLVHSPIHRPLLVLGYPDAYSAGDHVTEVMDFGPIGLEGLDDRLLRDLQKKDLHARNISLLPEGNGWLLVEFGADSRAEAYAKAREAMETLKRRPNPPSMRLFTDPGEVKAVWQVREAGVGASSVIPDEPLTWPSWEDAAVPPAKVGDYLRSLRGILDRYGYDCAFFGHFGQGCIHMRIDYNLRTAEGIKKFREFMEEAADLVIGLGGSLSGEHGDGQAHADLLPKEFGYELIEAMREFKGLWDPERKMNPGKVIDGYRMDQNLKLGTDYNPPRLRTHFQFPEDAGSFANAPVRCFGIGKCRRMEGDTPEDSVMCPSFMVTREEMHSTRGRAKLLFEMLEGDPIHGWHDETVREALDLCLACKGCKHDCPTRVDMASYKAEFLSHYYAGKPRPLSAYAMGLIGLWARYAALQPRLANFFTQTAVLAGMAKVVAGLAPQRPLPPFAQETFRAWFQRRGTRNEDGPPVILWADTFNNYFLPETAKAAVEVLEAAGCHVLVPERPLCCGRPLYDYGMLDTAKRWLRDILDELRPQIRAGIPVVGLEPSCIAVFRDELFNLFPHDEDAKRLRDQSLLLSEFLEQKVESYQPPRLHGKAVVHGHCHHKAIMTMRDEEAILGKLGLDYDLLNDGCCGLAGSFGFERGEHYDVSIAAGERVLAPAVRAAADSTLIITDGFSCREQIQQMTGRRAVHLAQVLQMALRQETGFDGVSALDGHMAQPQQRNGSNNAATQARRAATIGAGALVAGGLLLTGLRKLRSR